MTKRQRTTALVTGASSGIGRACARRLASLGIRVALSARSNGPLDELREEIGNGTYVVTADIADYSSVDRAVEATWEKFGHIDYVVHAAGIVTPTPLDALSPDVWREHIDVNLTGAYNVFRSCALRMRERGEGSIVAIASDLSFKGMPNYSHYCASKAGLAGLVKALALELAPNVRVNCVCPGPVDTPMMDAELKWFGGTAETRSKFVAGVPLKRFASPEEIAKFVAFVAIEMPFATGSMLSIDGGTTAG